MLGLAVTAGLAATQKQLFPNCDRPVRCCDGFIVCDNNHGKSIARTATLEKLTHHRHKVFGGEEVNSQARGQELRAWIMRAEFGACPVEASTSRGDLQNCILQCTELSVKIDPPLQHP